MSASEGRFGALAAKVPLRLVLVVAGLLLAAGLSAALYNERAYRQAREHEIVSQAQVLAASVTAALSFDDRKAIQEYVDAVGVNPGVRRIVVSGPDGVAVARLDRPQQPGSAMFMARQPVIQAGTRLGRVELSASTEGLWTQVIRFGLVALMMILAFVLVAALAAWQATLRQANQELDRSAAQLLEANRALQTQMEERAKAEDALRQSQKMEALGQLTGGLAHDFNNLLQAIEGAFQLIQKRPENLERVRVWSDQGLKAAERGARLTRQLLAFSRAQKLEVIPFLVSELVEGMRELLARTLGPQIELTLSLEDAGAPVLSDPTQLEVAILNLAINARDAMPSGGRLAISTRQHSAGPGDPGLEPGDYIEVSVADTGPGMAPEVTARAFDPFFTTKAVGKGTGLGLSQVYGVARQAGGEARIDSRPGEGATVRLFLRRAPSGLKSEPVRGERTPSVVSTTPTATILVVDDDDAVRGLVTESLELLGYSVASAASGEEALALLDQLEPDAAVLDFAMPGMDGAMFASLARAKLPALPIVFASGFADTAAVETAVGPDAVVLRKPFQLETLAASLSAMLRAKDAAAPFPAFGRTSPKGGRSGRASGGA